MKGWAFLLILLLFGGYLYLNGYVKVPDNLGPDNIPGFNPNGSSSDDPQGQYTNSEASSLRDAVISMGIPDAYVSLSSERTLVRLETPAVNENLAGILYAVAERAYESNPAKEVRVEAYYLGEPVVALTVRNGDFSNPELEDIRTQEFRVESDLGIFDVIITNVSITNESTGVTLEYLADRDGFWKDYFAMSFLILEDVPWVETVSITYLADNGTVTLSMSSEDLLRLQKGDVTTEELPGLVTVSSSSLTAEKG
ncbi:hypothetical protein [Thermococcus sp. GR6]|uniref:hypothetical protein n=1 Tax=Thermococcus sp. GR6 TaxID=1638256 RepID=UPI00142FCB3C|nr:hypothetical protein [Thermococcus sp. GR6]NJE43287.1 hypothetical protein [Thermococcus sp. GR6]